MQRVCVDVVPPRYSSPNNAQLQYDDNKYALPSVDWSIGKLVGRWVSWIISLSVCDSVSQSVAWIHRWTGRLADCRPVGFAIIPLTMDRLFLRLVTELVRL
jgi:hypothetical protein